MPMRTQFVRDDQPRVMPLGWGAWHLTCQSYAKAVEDAWTGRITGYWDDYTFLLRHDLIDPSDGEELTILPGDSFRAWRS